MSTFSTQLFLKAKLFRLFLQFPSHCVWSNLIFLFMPFMLFVVDELRPSLSLVTAAFAHCLLQSVKVVL